MVVVTCELLQVAIGGGRVAGCCRWGVAVVASECSSDSWVVAAHHIRLELGGVKLG